MKSSRGKIMVATHISHANAWQELTYHNTVVAKCKCIGVKDREDYTIVLDTGGFFTATTKKRMRQFAEMFDLPFRVWQYKGEWHWDVHDKDYNTLQTGDFEGNKASFTVTKEHAKQEPL